MFESPKAECFYAPRDCKVQIHSPWNVKIAVCATPVAEKTEPQVIHQDAVRVVRLGEKPWERDTSFIVDGSTNAKKLTIGEAYITPGNWAGFPPHKHDVDNMPSEGILEEIYYFLFDPQQGFGVQCLYTSDGEIDEAYRVKNDELVEFPRGYHTTVGAPGYNTYFLWPYGRRASGVLSLQRSGPCLGSSRGKPSEKTLICHANPAGTGIAGGGLPLSRKRQGNLVITAI